MPATVPPPFIPGSSPHPQHRLWWLVTIVAVIALLVVIAYFARSYSSRSAQITIDTSNPADAIVQLNKILAANPRDVTALILKSRALAEEGSTSASLAAEFGPQAASVADQAIAIDATSSEAYRALGYADAVEQKDADAHAAYQKAIALDPKNSDALFDDAQLYDTGGDKIQAAAGYRATLAVDPARYDAQFNLALIESTTGKTDAALSDFETVYSFSPDSSVKAEAAYQIGMLLIAQNNLDLARGYLESATTLDSSYALGWFGLGTVEYAQVSRALHISSDSRASLYAASIAALTTALKLDPNLSQAHFQLAEDYIAQGQKAQALSELSAASAVVPNDTSLDAGQKAAFLKTIKTFISTVQNSK